MILHSNHIKWYGRNLTSKGITYSGYSASGFEFCFTGKKAEMDIVSDSSDWNNDNKAVLGVYVTELETPAQYKGASFWENFNHSLTKKIVIKENTQHDVLFESAEEKTVVIKVLRLSEVHYAYTGLASLSIDGVQIPAEEEAVTQQESLKIEFIGDSITCGYGIEGKWEQDTFTTEKERADLSYAFYTAKKLGAEFSYVSWSGIGLISNYIDPSVNLPSNEMPMTLLWPYTDRTLSLRLKEKVEVWDEKKFSPDIVVINLGTNDTSYVRGIEERRSAFVGKYRELLESVHRRSPDAKICCCLGIMGQELCDSVKEAADWFKKDFPETCIKYVKFPVQEEADGIGTDWHPSEATHIKAAGILSEALLDWTK